MGVTGQIRRLAVQASAGRLLDAGVGTADFSPYYPPSTKVVGIDISPQCCQGRAERKISKLADVS